MIVGIPMKATQILEFVGVGGDITFDFAQCEISYKHAMQYLAYTKVQHTVINHNHDVLVEYIKCPQLIGRSTLIADYMNVMCLFVHGHMWSDGDNTLSQDDLEPLMSSHTELLAEQYEVLKSIPYFLAIKSGNHKPKNEQKTSSAGLNFARFFEDPFFLNYMLAIYLIDDQWRSAPYFTSLFEDYKYGGDCLAHFVIENPQCELTQQVFK